MKLAGFLQIYNEESKGNLRRCLDSMSRYCDVICIYDDASTDNSVDVAESYDKVKLIRGTDNKFDEEMLHKQELLELTLKQNPDWIVWMDADEIFEKEAEGGALRKLAASSDTDAHDFRQINFWRSERYYRVDGAYNRGIFCRLWRASLPLLFCTEHGLHKKPYPEGIRAVKTSDLRVLHYGFGSDDNIKDKYRTYKAHGQTGWDLERLVDEKTLALRYTEKEWLGREPDGDTIEEINQRGQITCLL